LFDTCVALTSSAVGFALVELTKQVCADLKSPLPCKSDPKSWGVTGDNDARLTPFEFSDFKTDARKLTELAAIKYISEPSEARQDKLSPFGIAATIAAPGTGKTRLTDDLLRATLPTTHYNNFLLLPITFNGNAPRALKHPLVVHALLQFVCGYVLDAKHALVALDHALHAICELHPRDVDQFDGAVLNAIEAVYFQLHGGTLGRSVLLVDELALARFIPSRDDNEFDMYKFVVGWIDDGAKYDKQMGGFSKSRRGAVFTGASILSPVLSETDATRPVVPLPLGTFNVYKDPTLRNVIQASHGAGEEMMVWALLAATSGRPRDILDVFAKLKKASLKPDAKDGKKWTIAAKAKSQVDLIQGAVLAVFNNLTAVGSPARDFFNGKVPCLSRNFIDNRLDQAGLAKSLIAYFGQPSVLGCSDANFPQYRGSNDMEEVHKEMPITKALFDQFLGAFADYATVNLKAAVGDSFDKDLGIVAAFFTTDNVAKTCNQPGCSSPGKFVVRECKDIFGQTSAPSTTSYTTGDTGDTASGTGDTASGTGTGTTTAGTPSGTGAGTPSGTGAGTPSDTRAGTPSGTADTDSAGADIDSTGTETGADNVAGSVGIADGVSVAAMIGIVVSVYACV
jgi:hypothetical protein